MSNSWHRLVVVSCCPVSSLRSFCRSALAILGLESRCLILYLKLPFPLSFSSSVCGTMFDKESVTGKRSFRMKQYPCARIYGYSKCKFNS